METKQLYNNGEAFSPYSEEIGSIVTTTTDNMSEGIVSGKYIHISGTINNGGVGYKEYDVTTGTHIDIKNIKGHANECLISQKNSEGKYTKLVGYNATNALQDVSYDVDKDMTIAISHYYSSPNLQITITNNKLNAIGANTNNIASLKNSFDQYKSKEFIHDTCYGYMLDKIAVIGDSLSCGTLDAVSGDDAHAAGGSFGCSWLTCLAKRWGSSVRMHYARGGATCYTWLGSNDYGLGLLLKDTNIYDAYFIALGHNDTGKYSAGTTSDTPTAVEVDDENNVSLTTSTSNVSLISLYKKIVNEIRTKAPNALIFCMTTYDKNSTSGIGGQNIYIKQVADWYREQGDRKVFFLNYAEKTDITRSTEGYGTIGHFSTLGYAYVAKVINECVNEVFETYKTTNALKAHGNYLESYRVVGNTQTKSGGYLSHL